MFEHWRKKAVIRKERVMPSQGLEVGWRGVVGRGRGSVRYRSFLRGGCHTFLDRIAT